MVVGSGVGVLHAFWRDCVAIELFERATYISTSFSDFSSYMVVDSKNV